MPASDSAQNGTADVVTDDRIADYRYPDKSRKKIPSAGAPNKAKVKEQPKQRY